MKSLLIFFVFILLCSSFVLPGSEELGKVNQAEGMYLFVDSRPVNDYEILGYVEKTMAWIGHYVEMKSGLVKRAAKKYPEADALVFAFQIWGSNKAAAIRFTEEVPESNLARVLKFQDLYIFIDSRPVKDYRRLGTVTKNWTWTGEYEEMRNGLIKKAIKNYPEADALLLDLKLFGPNKAEVIAFE